MPKHSRHLDDTLRALADPTRRAVVEMLAQRPASATEMAPRFDMALPSLTQHLRLLESAGVVRSRKEGRVRTYQLQTERLDEVDGWLRAQMRTWDTRLDQLDAHLMNMKAQGDGDDDDV